MIGMQIEPAQLFSEFCLNDHVPPISCSGASIILDLERVRSELKPIYSTIGRPSMDPELMMRMLIVGCRMGIRSERRLREEVHLKPGLSFVLLARPGW